MTEMKTSGDGVKPPAAGATVTHQIRSDIESTLSARRTEPNTAMRTLEDRAKEAGARAWALLKRHPYVGVAAIATLGVAAATTVGVAELAFGLGIAYATYNVLRGTETPSEAVKDVAKGISRGGL